MRLETLRWSVMSLTGNDVVMLPTNVSCQVPLLSLSGPRHDDEVSTHNWCHWLSPLSHVIAHQNSGDHDSYRLILCSISEIYQDLVLSKLLETCEAGFHGYLATVRKIGGKIEASIFKLVNQASRLYKKPVVEKLAQFRNTRHSLQHMVDKWGLLRKLLFKEDPLLSCIIYFASLPVSHGWRKMFEKFEGTRPLLPPT